MFNKDKDYTVTLKISAKDKAEVDVKIKALQSLASKVNTHNLTTLGKVAEKLGVNVKIKAFEKHLLKL